MHSVPRRKSSKEKDRRSSIGNSDDNSLRKSKLESSDKDKDSELDSMTADKISESKFKVSLDDSLPSKGTESKEEDDSVEIEKLNSTERPLTRTFLPSRDSLSIEEIEKASRKLQELQKTVAGIDFSRSDDRDPKLFRNLSQLKREIDMITSPGDKRRDLIYALPKSEWWRFFIDQKHRTRGPLAYDNEDSPGYYHAMMTLFEDMFSKISPGGGRFKKEGKYPYEIFDDTSYFGSFSALKAISTTISTVFERTQYLLPTNPEQTLSADLYFSAYYERVRNLILSRAGSSEYFLNTPPGWSGIGVASGDVQLNFGAIRELLDEGIIFIKKSPDSLGKYPFPPQQKGAFVEVTLKEINGVLLAQPDTFYTQDKAPLLVNKLFARYYNQMAGAKINFEKLRAIVALIRNLHIGHFLTDMNGRVNIMFLLNHLLMENGFHPALLQQPPDIFGGGATVNELVQAVLEGMAAFDQLVEASRKESPLPDDWSPYQSRSYKMLGDDSLIYILEQSVKEQLKLSGSNILKTHELHVVDGTYWECYVNAVLLHFDIGSGDDDYWEVMRSIRQAGINLNAQGVEIGSDEETKILGIIRNYIRKTFHVRARSAFDEDPGATSKNIDGEEILLLHTGAHFSLLNPRERKLKYFDRVTVMRPSSGSVFG